MKVKNLELFENLYDMVLELNSNDPVGSMCIAGSIIAKYDWNRIRYAVEHNWHLYDLDRWEAIAREFGRNAEYMMSEFQKYHLNYSKNTFIEIMQDGEKFIKFIVDPLYEMDVEVMELVPTPLNSIAMEDYNCRDIVEKVEERYNE